MENESTIESEESRRRAEYGALSRRHTSPVPGDRRIYVFRGLAPPPGPASRFNTVQRAKT